ncbi:MAG: hypothetical protein GPJ54_11345 [Candidatus Heimdallarchaeota archaeon]|nr:hypothetical protein [Candidatus Heimdallarchaeota archaeon]
MRVNRPFILFLGTIIVVSGIRGNQAISFVNNDISPDLISAPMDHAFTNTQDYYFRVNTSEFSYGVINHTKYTTFTFTDLGDGTMKEVRWITLSINAMYQVINGTYYYPTHYRFVTFDANVKVFEQLNFTETYTVKFQQVTVINIANGIVTDSYFSSDQFNATPARGWLVTSSYEQVVTGLEEKIENNLVHGKYSIGSTTGLYAQDVSIWQLNDSVSLGTSTTYYNVSSSAISNGINYWIIDRHVTASTYTSDAYRAIDKASGILLGTNSTYSSNYTLKEINYTTYFGAMVADDGDPTVSGPVDVSKDEATVTTLTFSGSDILFKSYEFYKNGEMIQNGSDNLGTWNFEVPVINGSTTYTFQIWDYMGKYANVSVIVTYSLLDPTTTSDDPSDASTTSDTQPAPIPGMWLLVSVFSYPSIIKLKKNSRN